MHVLNEEGICSDFPRLIRYFLVRKSLPQYFVRLASSQDPKFGYDGSMRF